ncbi:Flp family type IVb pilin [Paraurantiacibacter namhicola]|uniref:Flp/Fap pilin component n=1 Tax=Paraurantiacibacter namhicola TaxID=645517 RepID=A0A1C7D9Z6_9SPHN|nr:Flp family type IVb pilin [Paraurantiacibacter namhicola]ANU08192.1 Flp/Fap pilin component [Paraurantiacibacter namhicola]
MRFMFTLARIAKCERGATVVEYGLILALVFLAVAGGIAELGSSDEGVWTNVEKKTTTAMKGNV